MLMAVKYLPGATLESCAGVLAPAARDSEDPHRIFTAYCKAKCRTFGSSLGPINMPRPRSVLQTRNSEARTVANELPSTVMSRGFCWAGQLAGPGTPGA